MKAQNKKSLLRYTKPLGPFFIGVVFVIVAQAVASTTTASQDMDLSADDDNIDCLPSISSLLHYRKEALDRREQSIKDREVDITNAESRLNEQFKELEKIRDELGEKMKAMDAKKAAKVKALVARFEKVRAKQSAAILEKTDDDVAVMVLQEMKAGKAGKILAAMNVDKAAYLTEILAQHPLKKGQKKEKE